MIQKFQLPTKKAVIFWPVATGDATTLVLKPGEIVMQIDLHHLAKSENSEEPEWAIIDHLVQILPKRNGRPYLALFVLTHPDLDHIKGFPELLKRVDIGEIWHTPKIFRDQADEETLSDDAKAFRNEVHRRRKAILANPTAVSSGNRLRVIGHDDILSEDGYKNLPAECKSRPASKISQVDGVNLKGHFEAFVHAPFKDDQAANRNNTSLSLNIVLWEGQKYAQFFFFGDREYETTKRIFETTEQHPNNTGYLMWDVALCSHHCSKGVMYWTAPGESAEKFRKDVMDYFRKYSRKGYFVSSSCPVFTDGHGDCPPHKKARERYEEIVDSGHFICTHQYPNEKNPQPIVFTVGSDGFGFDDKRSTTAGPAAFAASIATARPAAAPPKTQVGFGST